MLIQGLIRRTGAGESTNIWATNWLPKEGLLRPIRSNQANAPQLVSELIDATTATWDQQKLHDFFTPPDIEVILGIPLNTRRQEDFWAWNHERSGIFSVRSAYRMLVINKERATAYFENGASRSNIKAEEKEWCALWRIMLPPKICIFLWCLARHSLPTGNVRNHRNMAPNSLCGICGAQDSWRHSLIECNLAKCVWALERDDILEHLLEIQEKDAKGWILACWNLYHRRTCYE